MRINNISTSQNFGVTLTDKAKQSMDDHLARKIKRHGRTIIRKESHEAFFKLLEEAGSQNTIMTDYDELSLLPKYKTSAKYPDKKGGIALCPRTILLHEQTLLRKALEKAIPKGKLNETIVNLIRDYPNYEQDIIKITEEDSFVKLVEKKTPKRADRFDFFGDNHPILFIFGYRS